MIGSKGMIIHNYKMANKIIKRFMRVKRHDTLPFSGWRKSTRKDLAKLLHELEYETGVEVGVDKGVHAREMLDNAPNIKLTLVDPWEAYDRRSTAREEIHYQSCLGRLAPYSDRIEYMKMGSMQAAEKIPDASLDFVYIDARHQFDYVMLDLIMWAPKIKPGGMISGHDYFTFYQSGVVPAVNAYTLAHNINEWYVTRDHFASFFWIQK